MERGRPTQQENRDLLGGATAAQQQRVALGVGQVLHRVLEELAGDALILLGQLFHVAAAIAHKHAIADGFGVELALITQFKAEHLAGGMEGLNLAPAVGQKFADAHDARQNLVEMVGVFALGADFFAFADGDHRARGL